MNTFTPTEPLRTPVLLTAFSRYDTAAQVMESIRAARPPRLYFACDGPRNDQERVKTDKVRSLVEMVDWPCEVHTRFAERNQGLKKAMIGNLDWFFDHEPEGIVLEDDTAPVLSFFWFCQELLERYRDDRRIWWILGNNLMSDPESVPAASYYFSEHGYGAPWGWAGWRRSWRLYDGEMSAWPDVRDSAVWNSFFLSSAERREARAIFEATWNGTIKTWDFQHDFARILNDGITIIPEHNLVRNIGFEGDGTNTVQGLDPRDVDNARETPFPLVHPKEVVVDMARDLAYFNAFIRPPLFRRVKDSIKGLLPEKVDRAITPFFSKLQKRFGA
ncbi:MAG TPA: nucleotide-diphospho-sugar transferase [Flavobacteriales bacterium]|nr:nucleotide-diphospho-sugar transferase [Flavobacteriales bacterium]HNU55911.1 nucleotide-diphospho-sugar transferase [Flavobacteriales bacterium]